ncbi:MAG: hypothetical protein JSS02_00250 [Planctomycetes bacterium]|nr:hypothetical protein [Planctomycetota bacterium]
MFNRTRTLLPEFIERLDLTNGWPIEKAFKRKGQDLDFGYKSGTLTNLKRGNPVPEKYCYLLIKMRWDHKPLHEVIAAFCSEQEGIDIARADDSQILNVICGPIGGEKDWFVAGLPDLGKLFDLRRHLSRVGRPAKDAEEVSEAVRWMFIDVGRLQTGNPLLPGDEAIRIAADWGHLRLEDYQANAISWWRRDRRTVMVGLGEKKPISMTIVLPLREREWHDVRDGNRVPYSLGAADLDVPSNYLVIEGLGQRPVEEGGESTAFTRGALMVMLAQLGSLSNCAFPPRNDLRILAFASNEVARMRLKKQHFKATGTKLHTMGVDLYDRCISCNRLKRSPLDDLALGIMTVLSHTLPCM